jgi:hypothetical protein
MMRRFALIIVLFTLAFTPAVVTAQAQPRGPFGHWGQVWGTFVWQTQVSPTIANPSLLTLHIDGTVSVSINDMFGSPTATTRRFRTPLHGVWERTSWQTVGGTSLYLISDATTGALYAWGRTRTSLTFSDDFNSFQGKAFMETLLCAPGPPVSCPDPLSVGATWVRNQNMPADGFSVTGTRLERVPAGPLP